jgi:hypothetical protein
MNITEAYERVLEAAVSTVKQFSMHELMRGKGNDPRLIRALSIIKPRVERMRSRLDHARARRAGKPLCPRGLEP